MIQATKSAMTPAGNFPLGGILSDSCRKARDQQAVSRFARHESRTAFSTGPHSRPRIQPQLSLQFSRGRRTSRMTLVALADQHGTDLLFEETNALRRPLFRRTRNPSRDARNDHRRCSEESEIPCGHPHHSVLCRSRPGTSTGRGLSTGDCRVTDPSFKIPNRRTADRHPVLQLLQSRTKCPRRFAPGPNRL